MVGRTGTYMQGPKGTCKVQRAKLSRGVEFTVVSPHEGAAAIVPRNCVAHVPHVVSYRGLPLALDFIQ